MNIKVFAIGGQWSWSINATSTGDVYVGTITDTTTAHSLLDHVESKGGYAVSLHGSGISGEYSLKDAKKLFQKKTENEHQKDIDSRYPKMLDAYGHPH